MTWEERNEQRLSVIYPPLVHRVRNFLADMNRHGISVLVTAGLRTYAEQDALYAQGRTAPGPIVTRARAGYSSHNFGLAVDVAPDDVDTPGLQIDWDARQPEWKTLVFMVRCNRLNSGITFGDRPHIYLEELHDTPTQEMRDLLAAGGLPAVWTHVNAILGIEN